MDKSLGNNNQQAMNNKQLTKGNLLRLVDKECINPINQLSDPFFFVPVATLCVWFYCAN